MGRQKHCDDQGEAKEIEGYVGLSGERREMYIYFEASGWKRSPLG
jgi:hypothetical protein